MYRTSQDVPKYKSLRSYVRPSSYIGPDYFDSYAVAGQSRDSDALERSNFAVMLERLGGESETVFVVRDSHWAVGWVETLRVMAHDTARCQRADTLLAKLADYPVLDEEHWSNLKYEDASTCWQNMPVAYRVELCQRFGVSVFAARRDDMPRDDSGNLIEYLRD